jgi:hypothetical protein
MFFLFFSIAIAGLAVMYALELHKAQFGLIWCFCDCENELISVERILQYISIPAEPPLVIEANRPDHSWPSHGNIDIDNLQVIFFMFIAPIGRHYFYVTNGRIRCRSDMPHTCHLWCVVSHALSQEGRKLVLLGEQAVVNLLSYRLFSELLNLQLVRL